MKSLTMTSRKVANFNPGDDEAEGEGALDEAEMDENTQLKTALNAVKKEIKDLENIISDKQKEAANQPNPIMKVLVVNFETIFGCLYADGSGTAD
jgi:TATA-binding protein-associated factor Taf7